jgi:hypothetical protein
MFTRSAIFGRLIFGRGIFGVINDVPPPTPDAFPEVNANRTWRILPDAQIVRNRRYMHKTPNEVLNIAFDWTDILRPDSIDPLHNNWASNDSSVVINAVGYQKSGLQSAVRFSGGITGNTYELTNVVKTVNGQNLSETILIIVRDLNTD